MKIEENEFKKTECRACGTKKRPIFLRQPPRDNQDFYCDNCMKEKKHL